MLIDRKAISFLERQKIMTTQTPNAVISSAGDHDKTRATEIVVSAYYRVHPDDRQAFIDAVRPEMQAAQKMPGCVYYAFSQDLVNPDAFHLSEGWADLDAYERHEHADTFLTALATVVKNVRILHREGMRYDVAKQHIDDPRGKVTS
jgi:quinol monooxygenase YgiN